MLAIKKDDAGKKKLAAGTAGGGDVGYDHMLGEEVKWRQTRRGRKGEVER